MIEAARSWDTVRPSRRLGASTCRSTRMPISKNAAMIGRGARKDSSALIAASACQRTGNRKGLPLADRGWNRRFDDPIPLPDGGMLRTLREAGLLSINLGQTSVEEIMRETMTEI